LLKVFINKALSLPSRQKDRPYCLLDFHFIVYDLKRYKYAADVSRKGWLNKVGHIKVMLKVPVCIDR